MAGKIQCQNVLNIYFGKPSGQNACQSMYSFSKEFWLAKIIAKMTPGFAMNFFQEKQNAHCQNATQPSEFGGGTLVYVDFKQPLLLAAPIY
jgi:hypothetical protein